MIFEELKCKNSKQTILDANHLVLYVSRSSDDVTRMVNYTAGKRKSEPDASHFIVSNELDAEDNNLESIILQLQDAYKLNKNTQQSYRHFIVSLSENESLNDNGWRKVIKELMTALGYDNAKYIAYKHSDTENEHVHIVTSTVDLMSRKVISNWQSHTNAQVVMRKMEKEFGLKKVNSSDNNQFKTSNINKQFKFKRMIGRKIDVAINNLNQNSKLFDFELELLKEGITIALSESSDEKFKGLTYSFNDIHFSASQLKSGNKYTLGGLIKRGVLCEGSNVISNYIPIPKSTLIAFSLTRKQAIHYVNKLKEQTDNFNQSIFNNQMSISTSKAKKEKFRNHRYWREYAKRIRASRTTDRMVEQAIFKIEKDINNNGIAMNSLLYNLFIMLFEDLKRSFNHFNIDTNLRNSQIKNKTQLNLERNYE
ncbi:relaxase/mobilization nuclease domain-containing protein [Vibrio tapetis]|nr:relaxase/mobilization nuclease domain-containing protein [Vibrio tapetis]